MVATALVLLSENDPVAPDLPGVASVSKDEDFDDGAFDVAAEMASRGALWTDRPYVTGNPSVDFMAERIRRAEAAGCAAVQVCNEINLPLENWQGGPEAYRDYYAELRGLFPGFTLLYQPPSPGVPGWQEWVDPAAPACAVHAYGSFGQMKDVVLWYLHNTAAELWVTECNFGAGQQVDVEAWARTELDLFLDWCAQQPRVKMAAYFAWRWDQSGSLPTSVDACDCPAIVEVLQKHAAAAEPPPTAGGGDDDDVVLSVPTVDAWASPANYTPGPRSSTLGVVVHCTRGGASPEEELVGTARWFQNPAAQVSAHLVVANPNPAGVVRCVHDRDLAWHAREANSTHLGLEVCQGYDGDTITDAAYRAAAEACRLWASKYGFPLERSFSIGTPGLIGHEDTSSGKQDGKTDPGGAWDWDYFMGIVAGGSGTSDPTALRDQTYALADQLQALGPSWEEAGYPQTAEYCRTQGEAIKKTMVIGKGEK